MIGSSSWESDRGQLIVREILRFSEHLFSSPAVMMTWVGEGGEYEVAQIGEVPDSFSRDYTPDVERYDPLRVKNLTQKPDHIHCLSAIPATDNRKQLYADYLSNHGFQDELDLVLSDHGAPVAILSVLRDRQFDATSSILSAFHRYTAQLFGTHPNVRRRARELTLSSRYQLTAREIEVVELIREGASNRDISEILGVGLSTVKTHVVRALDKVGARSRLELTSITSYF